MSLRLNQILGGADIRSPIFYDSNDTNYYIDAASTSVLNTAKISTVQTNAIAKQTNGSPITINSGLNASTGLRVYYDMQLYNTLFFTTSGWGEEGRIYGSSSTVTIQAATATTTFVKYAGYSQEGGSFRAPIFYDSNDTNYYVDPASTSVMLYVRAANFHDSTGSYNVNLGSGNSEGRGLVAGYSGGSYGGIGYNVRHTTTGGSWIAPSTDTSTYLLFSNGIYFYYAAGGAAGRTLSYSTIGSLTSAGIFTVSGDVRAPIFYDSNNTSYYLDPASTSNLNILSVTGYQYINGQTLNGQSFYQWEGATYRNPADHTPQLLITKTNSTTGINGFAPALALYNNNGADQTTVGMAFVSAEAVSPTQGNAVELAGIIAKKELAGTAGDWTRGSLNFYTKNNATRKDVMYMSPDGTVTVTGTDNNSGKADFSVDTAGTATMALSGQYFRVGSTDVNWSVKMQNDGYIATWAQQMRFSTDSGDNAITFATNSVNRMNIGGSTTETVKITGYANYVGNYGYNTLTLIDTSGYPGLNYRSGNNNWLMRMDNGGTYSMNWSSNASAKDVGTFSTPFYFGTGGTAYASNDFRAPIFYDSDNTSYYLNPAGSSQLSAVYANDWFRAQGNTGLYFQDKGYGITSAGAASNSYGNASTYGSGVNGWQGWGIGSRHCMMSTGGDNFGVHDNTRGGWLYYWDGTYHRFQYGYLQSASSVRAPLFYDSDDTTYYVDAASTSILNLLRTRNTFGERVAVTSAASTTVNTQYNLTELTMSASITTLTLSNIQSSSIVHMWTIVTVGNGTAYSITWPAAVKWPGGTAPTITSTNTKRDIYQFVSYDGGTTIYAIIVGQNL